MSYPKSANYAEWLVSSGNPYPAGMIWLKPGFSRMPSKLAQKRAGTVLDIAQAQAFRRAGDMQAARARLEFARAARLLL